MSATLDFTVYVSYVLHPLADVCLVTPGET